MINGDKFGDVQGFVCKITWHHSAAQTHGCVRPDAMDLYQTTVFLDAYYAYNYFGALSCGYTV